ncbi:MaoC family dehydratase [Pseudomaricurvus alkylphenolicus]|jgi:acyl dehydratase|uniref:MaoC family dehydratase n=1 Tax=Pseudomaricurvus alkylphenolicus TaxID=1306991 RepID=UPI001421EC5A|nr:MaoC family dehydratase [Pseudomaricurvus alkylphenolicus]NIB42342.1 MaoC family dehydratase [Pseudomaricurvus alkylphenolicus]
MTIIISQEKTAEYAGFETEPTEWFSVTQAQINQFADCTHDLQYIHVDPDRARATPFGSTIAHGFLTLSMLSHFADAYSVLIEGFSMGINYGFDKVRFIAPVKVNSRIRARAKIIEIHLKNPGQYQVRTEVTVEIEGEVKPALIADWLTLQVVS